MTPSTDRSDIDIRAAADTDANAAISRHYATAWLAVVEGNARARRFYERQGWYDAGPLEYAAEIPGGTLPVPTRRYEKWLGGS